MKTYHRTKGKNWKAESEYEQSLSDLLDDVIANNNLLAEILKMCEEALKCPSDELLRNKALEAINKSNE